MSSMFDVLGTVKYFKDILPQFCLFVKYTESTTFLEHMMDDHDFEEACYHWILSEICEMIRLYGYSKVLMDIDKTLRADDLEVELKQAVGDEE